MTFEPINTTFLSISLGDEDESSFSSYKKIQQASQYELTLHEDSNWKIIE